MKRARNDGMVLGIGADESEAYAPVVVDVGGQRVAVIAATQVIDPEYIESWTATEDRGGVASAKRVDRLVEAVTAARRDADTVVVYLHWGTETESCPNSASRSWLTPSTRPAPMSSSGPTPTGCRLRAGSAIRSWATGSGTSCSGRRATRAPSTACSWSRSTAPRSSAMSGVPGQIVDGCHALEGDEAAAAVSAWNELRTCTELATLPGPRRLPLSGRPTAVDGQRLTGDVGPGVGRQQQERTVELGQLPARPSRVLRRM